MWGFFSLSKYNECSDENFKAAYISWYQNQADEEKHLGNVRYKVYESPNKEDPSKMATSEMCVDDYNRVNNMNKVANGESCHLLASEQVKETDCFFMPPPPSCPIH